MDLSIGATKYWIFILTKLWRQIVREAGVPYHSLHGLRHTFATSLLSRLKSPKVVQDLLGHSSISVTLDLYTANLDDLGRDAVESLDVVVGSGSLPPPRE